MIIWNDTFHIRNSCVDLLVFLYSIINIQLQFKLSSTITKNFLKNYKYKEKLINKKKRKTKGKH